MKSVLIPIPSKDFDPTEVAIPYQILKHHRLTFATPDGKVGAADPVMLDGKGLGYLSSILKADATAVKAYREMVLSYTFNNPISYESISPSKFDAIILPGGHAPGMKPYLESSVLQIVVKEMMKKNKLIGAICHGVLLAARSGVLKDKKVTALSKKFELLAWYLTRKKLGDYYRTYPDTTVEDEVKSALSFPQDFLSGPPMIARDSLKKSWPGFVVRDGNLITARWPGDSHRFAIEILNALKESKNIPEN
jgi:protease I